MNLNDITVLTATYNNNILTGMMLKSLYKQLDTDIKISIIDNGTKIFADNDMKELFDVIDNTNFKLTPNYNQPSRNHCSSIDYAFKNCIKTKYVLLVDNDILFKPSVKQLLENLPDDFDCVGEVGWDSTPPNRLFPYFCIINLEKFKQDNLNYFDETRIIKNSRICNKYDTGYSFYEDIKTLNWNIIPIKFKDYIVHLKGAMNNNKNFYPWLQEHRDLY